MTDESSKQNQDLTTDKHARSSVLPSDRVDFDFPCPVLQASLSSLLTHSVLSDTYPSVEMHMTQPASSSLSESWASLSNSDYSPEDDLQSEHTDAGSLVDIVSTEDVPSTASHDPASQTDPPTSDVEITMSQQTEVPSRVTEELPTPPYNATASARSQYFESIEFEEPEQWPEEGQVDLRHTLTVFDDTEFRGLLKTLAVTNHAVQLTGSIRMTMSKTSLVLNAPFRMLYNGSTTAAEARADILRKVGDALVAGSDLSSIYRNMEASRYHVIPAEFGPGATPSFADLVPIQTQLVVEECVSAKAVDSHLPAQMIDLSLKNGDEIHSNSRGIRKNNSLPWNPPNIVILFVSANDSAERRHTTQLIHECMSRHHVPTLVICEERSWLSHHEGLTLDHHSLHRCIESRSTPPSVSRTLKKLPVDLDTFLNLDPEQLNKHFACLNEIALTKTVATTVSFAGLKAPVTETSDVSGDVEKNLSKSTIIYRQSTTIFRQVSRYREPLMAVLLVLFVTWVIGAARRGVSKQRFIDAPPIGTVPPHCATILTTSLTPLETNHKFDYRAHDRYRDLPTVWGKDVTRRLSKEILDNVNRSENFQVEIIGDCHIIVKAPQIVLQKRKEPQLLISIRRGDEEIQSTMSRLFDGVYSVRLGREDAYGPLNITITVVKPAINQTSQIDFGSPWLKLSKWDKAAQNFVLQTWNEFNLESLQSTLQSCRERVTYDQLKAINNATYQRLRELTGGSVRTSEAWAQIQERARILTAQVGASPLFPTQEWPQRLSHQAEHAFKRMSEGSIVLKERAEILVEQTSLQVKRSFDNLKTTVARVQVSDLGERFQELAKSDSLVKAQERAHRIVKDSKAKFQAVRQKANRRGRGKKRCRKCSRR